MKFFCIADEDTVRGFRLAGIPGRVAATAQETEAALAEAVSRSEFGIVILTDAVAAGIRPQIEKIRLEREQPLLLEIPGPEGPLAACKSLGQLVQEAVGIRLDGQEGG